MEEYLENSATGDERVNNELAQRRRDEIIYAARKLFAMNGYRRTRIDQIADRLEVGKGTIYRYFANKKELFIEVFKGSMEELAAAMAEQVERESDPRRRIETAVRAFFEYFEQNLDVIEISMQMRGEFREEHRRMLADVYRGYMAKLQGDLEEGVKRGLFRRMQVEETAEALSAAMRGVVLGYYVRSSGEDLGFTERSLVEKVPAVVELIMSGLLVRGREC